MSGAGKAGVKRSDATRDKLLAQDLDAAWNPVVSYAAAPTNRVIQAVVPAPTTAGFYRLSCP